jgi:PAS domain S-box-containing protein
MQVKQRLRINAVVSAAAIIAIVGVIVVTGYYVNRAYVASDIADAIITTSFERLMLRTDYHRTGSERSKEQLIAKHGQIGDLLKAASGKFTDPEDQKTISEMLTNHDSIGKVSKTIRENREKRGPAAHSPELEDRLISQLNMRVYDTVLLGTKLQQSSNKALLSSLRLAGGGILIVLLLISCVTLVNSRAMSRAITERIGRLREGAAIVGSGTLDHRIDVKGDDELSELSESFNSMTVKLQGLYDDFYNELALRKRAEDLLNRLNSELSQRVEEQTAEVNRANESLEQRIVERTAELEAANDTLRASRVAALNLMEDALSARAAVLNLMEDAEAARQQAEKLNVELQDEVAARKEAEKILQATYDRFYNVLSDMYAAILLISNDERVEFANQAFCDMYRLEDSPAELRGLTAKEMILKISGSYSDPDKAVARIAEIVKEGRPVIGEEVTKSDGRTCLRDFIPIFEGDKLYGRLWQHVDITGRKHAEESLRKAHDELEQRVIERTAELLTINEQMVAEIEDRKQAEEGLTKAKEEWERTFNSITDPIMIVDTHHTIVKVNRAMAEKLGVAAEDAEGLNCCQAVHESSMPPDICPHAKLVDDGEPHMAELCVAKLGGDFIVSVSPLYTPTGALFGSVHYARDITERKKVEEELRLLNEELEARVARRTEDLEFANKELESFSYSVSHDLRAPLRHMTGFVELLQKRLGGQIDETTRRYADVISGASKKMGHLIDDLLNFSRIGRSEIQRRKVNMNALVQTAIREVMEREKERQIEWKIGDLPDVTGDPSMLSLALVNLVSNAVKFTRESPSSEISISGTEHNQEYIFSIKDNGVGFDMKYAERLFGVFQRLHTMDEFEGTGIGLANVQRVIARHGGKVWAEGAVGQGATFYFTLPDVKED